MAAQPEPLVSSSAIVEAELGLNTRTASILPLRRLVTEGRPAMDMAPGTRLGPARGLMIGLFLGASLWLAIGLLAWLMF